MSGGHDVAIVGSGFAGSILARVLRRRGLSVLLLEKCRHPRFALGESSTPLAGFALERLAARYDLPDLHQLSTWGRWRQHLGQLRRGLKRGFTFYRHRPGVPFRNSSRNEARLLVAASPSDQVADCHWLRADVDHHLVRRAIEEGVELVEEVALDGVEISDRGVELAGLADGVRRCWRASTVVDASGPGGFLARHLPIAPGREPAVRSGLVAAHLRGLGSFVERARRDGAVLEPGPYPDDRAAVHHLVEEGWIYVLPFDHGMASVGLVIAGGAGEELGRPEAASDPAALWARVVARYPTLEAHFANAEPEVPFRYRPRIQHRLEAAAGERWLILPHTYAFFEPMFSTGIAWSLLAVERLADVLSGQHGDSALYGELLAAEADQIERLVAAAYRALGNFELFTSVSFLYFAAASYLEAKQRLLAETAERPHAWEGFLGADDLFFRPLFDETLRRLEEIGSAPAEAHRVAVFRDWLRRSIEARNLAGLADPERRNLYPADLELLVERAELLGLTREEVRAALPRLRGEAAC